MYLTMDIDSSAAVGTLRAGQSAIASGALPMSEHTLMLGGLVIIGLECAFVGFLAFRVYRRSDHLAGIIAATYLEARRALMQHKF